MQRATDETKFVDNHRKTITWYYTYHPNFKIPVRYLADNILVTQIFRYFEIIFAFFFSISILKKKLAILAKTIYLRLKCSQVIIFKSLNDITAGHFAFIVKIELNLKKMGEKSDKTMLVCQKQILYYFVCLDKPMYIFQKQINTLCFQ